MEPARTSSRFGVPSATPSSSGRSAPRPASRSDGSLAFVGVIAALAAFARLLYGKDDLTWRYTLGALLVAMVTATMLYGFLASYFPMIGGHASAAIGAAVGLFTDDVLKRARDHVKSWRFPAPKD